MLIKNVLYHSAIGTNFVISSTILHISESLASKDTSPSGTWKSDRFSSLLKSDKVPKSSGLTDGASEPSSATVHNEPNKPLEGTIEVEFEKGNLGLGFCIEGGKGSPLGDKPILVKRLFRGKYKQCFMQIEQLIDITLNVTVCTDFNEGHYKSIIYIFH